VTVTDPLPEPDDGSHDASNRCGLENSKYAQQGFVLVDSQGVPLGIMYSAIQNTIRWLEPCALEFVFEDDRGMWTVTIIGADSEAAKAEIRKLQMRLIQQKRELLHSGESGNVIRSITVEKMEQKEEA
jgi:hypothetical protein